MTTHTPLQAGEKPPLVYLVHRIPYPPNKGDKLRSWNLLLALKERFRVYLGCFVDDPHDWKYVETLRDHVEDVCALRLSPKLATLRSAQALVTGQPQSVPYYQSQRLQRWVDRKIQQTGCQHAVAFSSSMAQYLRAYPELVRVADLVDADSAKWSQYAESCKPPMRWVYQREGQQLAQYENAISREFNASVLVTAAEAGLLTRRPEVAAERVHAIENGVDWQFFDPALEFADPYSARHPTDAGGGIVAFTGAMDYRANVDAALWFLDHVWPRVRQAQPLAQFWLVGANPSAVLLDRVGGHSNLGRLSDDGLGISGRVDDIRTWIAHADCLTAPLRIARGVQNKVLEALAMGRPLVASAAALEGLQPGHGCEAPAAAHPEAEAEAFAAMVVRGLRDPASIANNGRDYVCQHYDWQRNLSAFNDLLGMTGANG